MSAGRERRPPPAHDRGARLPKKVSLWRGAGAARRLGDPRGRVAGVVGVPPPPATPASRTRPPRGRPELNGEAGRRLGGAAQSGPVGSAGSSRALGLGPPRAAAAGAGGALGEPGSAGVRGGHGLRPLGARRRPGSAPGRSSSLSVNPGQEPRGAGRPAGGWRGVGGRWRPAIGRRRGFGGRGSPSGPEGDAYSPRAREGPGAELWEGSSSGRAGKNVELGRGMGKSGRERRNPWCLQDL